MRKRLANTCYSINNGSSYACLRQDMSFPITETLHNEYRLIFILLTLIRKFHFLSWSGSVTEYDCVLFAARRTAVNLKVLAGLFMTYSVYHFLESATIF